MPKPEQVKDSPLRELIERGYSEIRQQQATQAVHTLVDALYRLLEIKPELVTEKVEVRKDWKISFLTRWPQLGANWKKGSLDAEKPEIEYLREKFSLSEAITYYEFILDTSIKRGA